MSRLIKKLIPRWLWKRLAPYYHECLAYISSVYYRHPSKELVVIGVTGTKGKSSVAEMVTAILTSAGFTVATVSTIHFKIGDTTEKNLYKMTMPGRFFLQKFMRRAVTEGCTHIVLEMTSEGAHLNRHRFIEMDTLIFTNLTPEHIESHGSFAAYKAAKLKLATQLSRSTKSPRSIIANVDDEHGADFLATPVEQQIPYSLQDLSLHSLQKDSVSLVFGDTTIRAPFVGLFNVYNALAAITYARSIGITWSVIDQAFRTHPPIKGRVEQFTTREDAVKPLTVVVDYAHTPDSLRQLYEAFPDGKKVCVLGNTGGGRDTWKRPEMAQIAEQYCEQIILTNEDPYDENPLKIIEDMYQGINNKAIVSKIIDRKEAIATAIASAPAHSYVLVSGKGTDPYIMGPNGTKQPWSDAKIVQEILYDENKTSSVT